MHVKVSSLISQRNAYTHVSVIQGNLFDLNLKRDLKWTVNGPLLVVGNPPWVTNAELGALNSNNLPQKTNLKQLQGFEALTGASNFDIAEYIWLKLLRELLDENATIALLCKTSVARNVLLFAEKSRLPIRQSSIRRIDAKRWFNASVDACLFYVEVGTDQPQYTAHVFNNLSDTIPDSTLTISNGRLIADMEAYAQTASIDGEFAFEWRQGLKHDAAQVME